MADFAGCLPEWAADCCAHARVLRGSQPPETPGRFRPRHRLCETYHEGSVPPPAAGSARVPLYRFRPRDPASQQFTRAKFTAFIWQPPGAPAPGPADRRVEGVTHPAGHLITGAIE
jgi:hypothetical protein